MNEPIIVRGLPVSPEVDPKAWFEVSLSTSWDPPSGQLTAFASVAVRSSAPAGLKLSRLRVEVTTKSRPRPVRAVTLLWGATEANCQVQDTSYTQDQPPGNGKMSVDVGFEGSYEGTASWEKNL